MLALSSVLFNVVLGCPGSMSPIHAGANMNVEFQNTCAEVAAEIEARASASSAEWQDPHNHGTYSLLESKTDYILTKRTTKNKVFTDKQDFTLTPSADGNSCSVVACSESQGLSAADGGTNICDMFDLFCNKEACSDGNCCTVLKNNLTYKILSKKCYPFFFNCPSNEAAVEKTCLKMPSSEEELAEYQSNAIHLERLGAFKN